MKCWERLLNGTYWGKGKVKVKVLKAKVKASTIRDKGALA